MSMQMKRRGARSLAQAMLLACGMVAAATPALATDRSEKRQQARETRQDTRQNARETKQDCRAADQKSNVECRWDKRSSKQQGREAARDIKY